MVSPDNHGGTCKPDGPDQLRGLLDAHRTIASDLDLSAMLDRIVHEACEMVGARYAALGVIGADGRLQQFLHHGIDNETVARIGRLPEGRGLIGALLADPSPIRVADVADDPRGGGFPPGHPPMRAFLGIPIRIGTQVFGDLYLAEPESGQFTRDDERLVTALAALAGTAIQNARLYEDARRNADWLEASGEITRALLANTEMDVLLAVVWRALHAGRADYGALIVPTDGGKLKVMTAAGVGAEEFYGTVFDPRDSSLGKVMLEGRSQLLGDLGEWARTDFVNRWNLGPTLLAPLIDAQGTRGAVLLMRTRDRPPFDERDLALATTFAAQVALALQFDDARTDAEWLRTLEDRHRIARDLHDNVIQRLFAVGVGLQSLAERPLTGDTSTRLRGYVNDLDTTIDQIRDRVFGLRGDTEAATARRGPAIIPRLPVVEPGSTDPHPVEPHSIEPRGAD